MKKKNENSAVKKQKEKSPVKHNTAKLKVFDQDFFAPLDGNGDLLKITTQNSTVMGILIDVGESRIVISHDTFNMLTGHIPYQTILKVEKLSKKAWKKL